MISRSTANMVRKDLTLVSHVKKIVDVIRKECGPGWDAKALRDPRLSLLTFIKHHLALTMMRDSP